MEPPNLKPVRKVQAGVLGNALGIIATWILSSGLGMDVPAEVGGAISLVFGGILAYIVPSAEGE